MGRFRGETSRGTMDIFHARHRHAYYTAAAPKVKYSTSRREDVQYWRLVNRIYTVIGAAWMCLMELTRFVIVHTVRY